MSVEHDLSADFEKWESEMAGPDFGILADSVVPAELEPYGADMLISPTSTAVELGVLACINGSRGSTVDDDTGLGSKTDDWVQSMNLPEPAEDITSLS